MKKIFLFLIALVSIVACSKSDSGNSDNGGGGSVAGYNPPDWIIGTWINNNIGYSFTKKDYCITAGTELCYLSGSMKQAKSGARDKGRYLYPFNRSRRFYKSSFFI